ncbi:similar to germ cell-less (predicted) [Rattus norvegicus]|uniref:Germ cell-less 1, spermatogenesis associated, pseudogene 1 n=2 Tax=Rattus norvegicus TaxID=10116 RepID=A0A0G2K031_RAT|nr:similar to germ cell-less (predicted) [Rattus norvegicus]
MGALSSRMWSGRNPEEDEPAREGAAREEEAAVGAGEQAGPAVVQEEQASELPGVSTGQAGHKRKASPGGPKAKVPRKKMDKSRGIYESLFLGGENSDVKICAFQQEWCLHRAYLCRSGYFSSMFCGAWLETNMNTIEMQMPDENIDREAFHEVLGFLYSRRIAIPPSRVIAILATASMLQLDELIQQCEDMMRATVRTDTVCSYYYSAENYGLQSIRYICRQWLLDNLMIRQNDELLLEINLNLMRELIASSDLLVVGVEMDVYITLKKWMYLQLEARTCSESQRAVLPAQLCFAKFKSESDSSPFLDSNQGRTFVPVFQKLRLPYIICDLPSAHVIDQDGLIPATWLTPVYKEQWLALLRAEQSRELGPMDIYVSDIGGNSMRCGGQLISDEQCSWTWTGFNFGWDLVVCYVNKRIVFRRSAMNKSCGLGVSLLWQRKVAFRLRVISLDSTGKAVLRRETEYSVLSLRKDQELEVVNLQNQDLTFPMYVACNFLYLPGESGAGPSGESSRSPMN